jgi:hypothetical protein
MLGTALDFEGVVENAIATLLRSNGLTVFISGEVYDFQKDRPRVQVQYTHGPGRLIYANPQALPADLAGQKIETAWASTLHTTIVTSADATGKQDQSDIRSTLRFIYMNLAPRLNGNLLTVHKFNLAKDAGSTRGLHPQDSNSEILQLVHEIQISLHESVWSSYERITQDGAVRVSAIRITN